MSRVSATGYPRPRLPPDASTIPRRATTVDPSGVLVPLPILQKRRAPCFRGLRPPHVCPDGLPGKRPPPCVARYLAGHFCFSPRARKLPGRGLGARVRIPRQRGRCEWGVPWSGAGVCSGCTAAAPAGPPPELLETRPLLGTRRRCCCQKSRGAREQSIRRGQMGGGGRGTV